MVKITFTKKEFEDAIYEATQYATEMPLRRKDCKEIVDFVYENR